jgi:hypothetical protein
MKKGIENSDLQTRKNSYPGRRVLFLPLPFVAAFLVFAGCASKQFRMLTTVGEHYPSATRCEECHIEIYEEWKKSPHSTSYSNDTYRMATNDHSFQDCLGCHSPVSIHSPGIPAVRGTLRDEGVTCVSCHFRQGRLVGPVDTTAKIVPHEVGIEKDFFRTSELCGTCHQGTFDEWRRANVKEKKNCQDCHMPEVKRKVTQASGVTSRILVSMEDVHSLKRHTFDYRNTDIPEDIVQFDVRWLDEKEDCSVEVSVLNKLPHLIPTGDFGFRKGILIIQAETGEGVVAATKSVELYKEIKTALPPMETRSFRFSLPNETQRVKLTLARESRNETNRFIIAENTFPRYEADE